MPTIKPPTINIVLDTGTVTVGIAPVSARITNGPETMPTSNTARHVKSERDVG
jgi:hypothetical protein